MSVWIDLFLTYTKHLTQINKFLYIIHKFAKIVHEKTSEDTILPNIINLSGHQILVK